MTYEIERGSIAVCPLQTTDKSFDTEGTTDGTKREPAERWGVVLCSPWSEGAKPGRIVGREFVCRLSKGYGPEQE